MTNTSYTVLLAKFPGVCACGGTVGLNDPIRYELATRRVVACYGCTTDVLGGYRWKFKGDASDNTASALRQMRARNIVNERASVARWIRERARAADPVYAEGLGMRAAVERLAKCERLLGIAKSRLAEAEIEAKGSKGEPAWARPTARDIELAEIKRAAEQARRETDDAEERAAL